MKQLETTHFLRFVFALVIMVCVSTGYSQDLAQAKALCGNVTEANKAMAKQAGYDLDVSVEAASQDHRLDEFQADDLARRVKRHFSQEDQENVT